MPRAPAASRMDAGHPDRIGRTMPRPWRWPGSGLPPSRKRRAMNKPALLAAVTAGLVVGAVLGVYAPRWFASGAGRRRRLRHAGARQAGGATGAGRRGQASAFRARHLGRGQPALGRVRGAAAGSGRPHPEHRFQGRAARGAGQALVRLDDSVPRAELAQARANLTLAQTHYRRAVELQGRASSARRRGTSPPARSRCRKPPWRWRRRAWTR